jgi:hypothetical protein
MAMLMQCRFSVYTKLMISRAFFDRLVFLPTTESGAVVSWRPSSLTDPVVGLTTLVAFSWCYFFELSLEAKPSLIPETVTWLNDVMRADVDPTSPQASMAFDVSVRGPNEYILSLLHERTEAQGMQPSRASATRAKDAQGRRVQRAKCTYWCWPLPPEGEIEISVLWPEASVDSVIARFDSEAVQRAARQSIELDEDMRPIRP